LPWSSGKYGGWVEKDKQSIGIAALYFHEGNIGITDFVILKEFHRQGIGTALLQDICSFAHRQGASTQGARFYPRLGFENLGHFPTYLYSKEMQSTEGSK
jgi:GNAT superfamily N-acetyltransferase